MVKADVPHKESTKKTTPTQMLHHGSRHEASEVRRACAVGESDVIARAPCAIGRRGELLVGMR